ncbi:MAG: DUF1499 domain-containing protein [Saccharospirillum sp.]
MKLIFAIVVALFVVNLILIYWQNSRVPALGHDQGQLKPLGPRPNSVSTQTDHTNKWVQPWPFKDSREKTMAAVVQAVQQYGGARIVEQDEHYLYVVFTTKLMRYHDDAEFYLNEEEQQVHFRSASRAGHSDMGLNRKRFDALTELYRQADV